MGQRDTRRERLVTRVLVALGVFGVLVIVGLVAEVAETEWNWHKIRTGLRFPAPVGRKDVHVSGCDHAFLDEPTPLDAGSAKAVPHYMLYCGVEGTTKPLPTCDEIIARYVAANGPLPTAIRVNVWHERHRRSCDETYAGDGTPK